MSLGPHIIIIDCYDSFTYNIHHYVSPLVKICEVIPYDDLNLDGLKCDGIILSPGPGHIKQYPKCIDLIKQTNNKPILGICLGMQLIASYFGGLLYNLNKVLHGISSNTNIIENSLLFKDIPNKFLAAHYHSWAISEDNFPKELKITSKNDNGIIMSFEHYSRSIHAVQFHPESVLTPYGKKIIFNWVKGNFN